MHLFQIENITFKPLLVIAHDFDHAADIFRHSLVTGLAAVPDADFDIVQLNMKRRHQDRSIWSWLQEGRAGMLWRANDGAAWEMTQTSLIRGDDQ